MFRPGLLVYTSRRTINVKSSVLSEMTGDSKKKTFKYILE